MKTENIFILSLDILRFINPLQIDIGLYGNNLNGILLIVIILSSIAGFPFLRQIILNTGIVEGSYFVTFAAIFISIVAMIQNESLQSLAVAFISFFRFIDGFGLGRFISSPWHKNLTHYIVGVVFSTIYGILLFVSLKEKILDGNLLIILAYSASYIIETLALIGLSGLIYDKIKNSFQALLLSVSCCMLVVSSFLANYEYQFDYIKYVVLLAFPMGIITSFLTKKLI